MMALRVRELPVGNWFYELKFDGYQAVTFKAGKEVRLLSRTATGRSPLKLAKRCGCCRATERSSTMITPQLVDALKSLRAKDFILDGEIAALDPNWKTSFQLLQSYGIRKQTRSFITPSTCST
jgi:bifunctional non-homologous end joining protein LigD